MKNLIKTLPIIFLFWAVNISFAQIEKKKDLLAGVIQESGLPAGWMRAADNFECTVKFQNGSIYFERLEPEEKCSFAFSQNAENGEYLIKTAFTIDGNAPKIFLDGNSLEAENIVKVTNGRLHIGIQTKGDGKVWGTISRMTSTKIAPSVSLSADSIEKIKIIAANSPVAKYTWKDRGKAPIGYIKGIAVTYAKSYLELKTKQDTAVAVMSQAVGDSSKDALAWYEISGTSDVDRLRSIYMLALGLGMRESDGNTTTGWDKSKLKAKPPIKPTADNSEAGIFQTSWDSRNRSPWLLKLYSQYKANPNQCSLAIFMEKVTDNKEAFYGTGEGLEFQKFNKQCPSFATEYVMIMLRENRKHFGPIKEKKAEYNLDAEQMFRDIEKVVDGTL
jgi:hypothetical protein